MLAESIANMSFHLLLILSFMTIFFFSYQDHIQDNIINRQSDIIVKNISDKDREKIKRDLNSKFKDVQINVGERERWNINILRRVSRVILVFIFICMLLITILKYKYNFDIDGIIRDNIILLIFLILTYILFFSIIKSYVFIN